MQFAYFTVPAKLLGSIHFCIISIIIHPPVNTGNYTSHAVKIILTDGVNVTHFHEELQKKWQTGITFTTILVYLIIHLIKMFLLKV